ncbi:MAG: tRNA (adenosine(37)-N6)-threonylcarbamoyltransferase complex transferase subunit TsaD [Eubacteriales bacterium]|nr:tRNA (adenosine(37)-N6)-threonylcarbamoyltransferase complex transferase subunit TsaD [Eubacteriales bacterium]
MKILAIESSCDESACAIVEDGRHVLANVVASQADLHASFGGVVPEIASREHIHAMMPVVDRCLKLAKLEFSDIDCIAVTAGPGLIGALLVGVSVAKALAFALNKNLYAIHHIAAHIAGNFLTHPDFEAPFLCLVVSGGHSHLIHCDESWHFKIIGRTRDDAAGEALDKIARALKLPYPGGPKIEAEAQSGKLGQLRFPKVKIEHPYDYSFSGVKSAALNYLQKIEAEAKRRNCSAEAIISRSDFCADYQEAIFSQLTEKAMAACRDLSVERFAIAGGVAANQTLRNRLANACELEGIRFFAPERKYCTDNAAMVGSICYYEILAGAKPATWDLNAKSTWDAEQYLKNAPVI